MARASLKEQLVDRSAAVFIERGYNAASVNDIVQAARVPKGSFYNHFQSKEALAIEVLRRYVDDLGLRELADPHGSPLANLRAHLEASIAAREITGIEYGCLLGNFSTDAVALNEGLREAVTRGFAQWIDAVATAISRGQSAGEITNPTDAHRLARYVVSSFEGAIAQTKTLRVITPVHDFLAVTFDVVLR
jgi:TetR/AcrR family transcriptional repressor of nem operon